MKKARLKQLAKPYTRRYNNFSNIPRALDHRETSQCLNNIHRRGEKERRVRIFVIVSCADTHTRVMNSISVRGAAGFLPEKSINKCTRALQNRKNSSRLASVQRTLADFSLYLVRVHLLVGRTSAEQRASLPARFSLSSLSFLYYHHRCCCTLSLFSPSFSFPSAFYVPPRPLTTFSLPLFCTRRFRLPCMCVYIRIFLSLSLSLSSSLAVISDPPAIFLSPSLSLCVVVVAGFYFRYSPREHALISGLLLASLVSPAHMATRCFIGNIYLMYFLFAAHVFIMKK